MEHPLKILIPAALATFLIVAACARSPQHDAAPRARAAAASPSTVHAYRCESGETILASYLDTDTATVRYKGSAHSMQIAISGSGARYVGGDLEWWTKGSGPGSEGTLFRHRADGSSGEIIERCTAR